MVPAAAILSDRVPVILVIIPGRSPIHFHWKNIGRPGAKDAIRCSEEPFRGDF